MSMGWRGMGGKGPAAKGKEKEMRDSMKRNHDLSVKVSSLRRNIRFSGEDRHLDFF